MARNSVSCAWGKITPDRIEMCRPERPERRFRTSSPVTREKAAAIKAAIQDIIGVIDVEPSIVDGAYGFSLVYESGMGEQEIALLTSVFLRKLTRIVNNDQDAHVVPHRTTSHVTPAEIASAMAIGGELRPW